MLERLIFALRRRIAVKLTLTLLGFVAVTVLVAGLYLNRTLERLAAASLETRLAVAGALLHDEARALLTTERSPEALQAFALRAALPSHSRVTLITPDGRVGADSEVTPAELPPLEDHPPRPPAH